MGKFSIWLCTAFVALAMWATPASADSITYKFEGIGAAEIGIAGIVSGPFTLTMTADTANINDLGTAFTVPVDSAGIHFSGWGGADIDPTGLLMAANAAGFGGPAVGSFFVFSMFDPGFATYELDTSIGPIFDPAPSINPSLPLGLLNITGDLQFIRLADVTFTASRVPEPASMALFAISGGLIYWRRKRQRA